MYKIVIDIGKPMTEHAEDIAGVRIVLESTYQNYIDIDESPYVDVFIYDDEGRDVTEDMVFQEMFADMVEEEDAQRNQDK